MASAAGSENPASSSMSRLVKWWASLCSIDTTPTTAPRAMSTV